MTQGLASGLFCPHDGTEICWIAHPVGDDIIHFAKCDGADHKFFRDDLKLLAMIHIAGTLDTIACTLEDRNVHVVIEQPEQ